MFLVVAEALEERVMYSFWHFFSIIGMCWGVGAFDLVEMFAETYISGESWKRIDACMCMLPVTSFSHFFEGVNLTMAWILVYLRNIFHCQIHLQWILSFRSCQEVAMLQGRVFLSNFGRSLPLVELPSAAFLVCVSAFSFVVNFASHYCLASFTIVNSPCFKDLC